MQRHLGLRFTLLAGMVFFMAATAWSEDRRETGELKSYQCIKLGSVNDFRENSIGGVRKIDPGKYRLRVDGRVRSPHDYTYQELKSLLHEKKLVTTHCVEGWKVTVLWEGIPIRELIRRAGVDAKVNTIIFHAADGYTTSLEYQTVAARNLLIADSANGITLPAKLGFPFILVAEEKWGYKWARWIERIEFSEKKNFRGYWEQRGYNQKGDLSGPELEDR